MWTQVQVEAAAAAAAEKANGGKFADPLFYKPEHRAFWCDVIRTALDAAVGTASGDTTDTNPESIDTTVRLASMRQTHCAIGHAYSGEFECAITLAGAAEGILPTPNKPFVFEKLKAFEAALPTQERVNDITNWLKHAKTLTGGNRIETANITEVEVIATVTRAISKFIAVYGEQSREMKSFTDWAITRLEPVGASAR
jgi:hypothetical protein